MTDRPGTVLHADRLPELIESMRRAEEAAANFARALRDVADAEEALRAIEAARGSEASVLAQASAKADRDRVHEFFSDLLVPTAVAAGDRFKAALRRLHEATAEAVHPAG